MGGGSSSSILARAAAFLDGEVDPGDRAELEALIERTRGGDPAARGELSDRFRGPLRFGTAGIRGILGAGESRMNRSVVLRTTHGLVSHLLESVPRSRARGIVVARDGRRRSEVFQEDAVSAAAGLGVAVHRIEGPQPTPLLAYAVRHLGTAAGVMITASHNPPEYNGYKVYWENGAQIVPPIDERISASIDAAPPARRIRHEPTPAPPARVEEDYLSALLGLGFEDDLSGSPLRVAYSALHGCGQRLFVEAMRRKGFERLHPVPEQAEPDGAFPTVRFPNPEEPGALDLVLELARRNDCDLAIVQDPDADRLGAAVRRKPGDYVVLNGNEIGALLGHYVLSRTREPKPLVVSTIVSSRLLSRMAGGRGVRYEDTLTGFKWIANEAMRIEAEEGVRFVFGFEEALGYTVGTAVRDKDGIGAGLVLAEMAAWLKSRGETLLDALGGLRRRYGHHASRQRSVPIAGAENTLDRLRAEPRFELGGESVAEIWDVASGTSLRPGGRAQRTRRLDGEVLVYELRHGGRVAVRASGTEPKLKLYLEVVEPFEDERGALARAERRLDALEAAVREAGGLD